MIIHDNNKNGIRNFQNQNLQENALVQKVTNRVPVSQPSPNGIPGAKSVQNRVICWQTESKAGKFSIIN